MKKIIIGLLSIFFFGNIASAETFGTANLTPLLSFEAQIENGGVSTRWQAWQEDFMWYKLSRSQNNANPIYPEDGAIFWSSDANETVFFDNDPPHGKSFYRICAITHAKNRFCSNVVALDYNPEDIQPAVASLDMSSKNSESNTENQESFCAQIITSAQKRETQECRDFSTPCDVPEGWEIRGSCSEKNLTLSALFNESSVALKWEKNGVFSEEGIKLIKSQGFEVPVFPVTKGSDSSIWISAQDNEFVDEKVKPGTNYTYRVCEYLGKDQCGTFSNVISVKIPENDIVKKVNTVFSDIESDTEMGDAILRFAAQGVVNGFEDGTFQPEKPVTRAELAKMTTLALNKKATAVITPLFCDIPVGEWYAPFVHFFAKNDFVKGFESKTCDLKRVFSPHNPVKRNEAIKMIIEATGNRGTENNADWFQDYFEKAIQQGILSGNREDFGEMQEATRGEIMLFLDRAL